MLGQRHWQPYPAELPGSAGGAGAPGASSNLALLLALLDNNVQSVGPVSAAADTVSFTSAPFTLLPGPTPGNATVDVKASMSVTGTAGDAVTFELWRNYGVTTGPIAGQQQQLTIQQSAISPSTGLASSATLAFLDTNVGTFPSGFQPIVEGSTNTYSIVALSAATLTGANPALISMEQLPSGSTATVGASPPSGGFLAGTSLLNFAGFAGAGISTTGASSITGSIGLGPGVTSSAFTGFGQTLTAGAPAYNQYATAPIVHAGMATTTPYSLTGAGQYVDPPADQGVLYAADYAVPTPANVNTTNNDMLSVYTSVSSQIVPGANLNVAGGVITAGTGPFVPGVYKWTTPVTATGMTLNGAGVYVFIITGTFDLESAAAMILEGGAIPSQIYFAIAGAVTLHTTSAAFGEFLAKTNIAMLAGATLTGRALAQTGLTLSSSTIIEA